MGANGNGSRDQNFAHDPSREAEVEAEGLAEAESWCDLSLLSPEQQVWENLLKAHLGSFYYPRYLQARKAGRETAWDYVEDAPGLPRILVIGDSISRGCTLPLRHALQGKVNVHRAPQNCSSTVVGIEKLDVWLGDGRWDLITFNFGIHDRDATSAVYKTRLAQITRRLEATGAKLVWVTTTPVPEGANEHREESVDRLNTVADELMKEHDVPILDLDRAITPLLDQYQLPENCHFKGEGYVFMGKLMAETVLTELPGDCGRSVEGQ